MNAEDLKVRVLEVLTCVAPDIDVVRLDPHAAFRDQFDFDSMDTLNFAIGLHRAFNVIVPEVDYLQLASLSSTMAYLQARIGA